MLVLLRCRRRRTLGRPAPAPARAFRVRRGAARSARRRRRAPCCDPERRRPTAAARAASSARSWTSRSTARAGFPGPFRCTSRCSRATARARGTVFLRRRRPRAGLGRDLRRSATRRRRPSSVSSSPAIRSSPTTTAVRAPSRRRSTATSLRARGARRRPGAGGGGVRGASWTGRRPSTARRTMRPTSTPSGPLSGSTGSRSAASRTGRGSRARLRGGSPAARRAARARLGRGARATTRPSPRTCSSAMPATLARSCAGGALRPGHVRLRRRRRRGRQPPRVPAGLRVVRRARRVRPADLRLTLLDLVVATDRQPGRCRRAALPRCTPRAGRLRAPAARAPRSRGPGRPPRAGGFSDALYLATVCEDGPFPWAPGATLPGTARLRSPSALAALPSGSLGPFAPWAAELGDAWVCAGWPSGAADTPAPSGPLPDVPVLAFSGGLDLRTADGGSGCRASPRSRRATSSWCPPSATASCRRTPRSAPSSRCATGSGPTRRPPCPARGRSRSSLPSPRSLARRGRGSTRARRVRPPRRRCRRRRPPGSRPPAPPATGPPCAASTAERSSRRGPRSRSPATASRRASRSAGGSVCSRVSGGPLVLRRLRARRGSRGGDGHAHARPGRPPRHAARAPA